MSALPPLTDVYRQHRRRAVALARRILHDADEAEDVVQEVFTRLHAQGIRFDGAAAYTTWLHRVLVNSSINQLRAQRRRGKLTSPISEPVGPDEAAEGREERALLLAALERLSEQHRLVITLRDLRGLSYPEIARTLGLPEGTVKSALNRGRANLMSRVQAMTTEARTEALNPAGPLDALPITPRSCLRRIGRPCRGTAR